MGWRSKGALDPERNPDEFLRSKARVSGKLGVSLERDLTDGERLAIQIGLRYAHAEEALTKGETERGEGHEAKGYEFVKALRATKARDA